jgi:hypothetical protein
VLTVGYTTNPQPGFVPVIASGTIDLATETGPGQCFAPTLGDCGAFTFKRIDCPAQATSSTVTLAAQQVRAQGRAQGAQ